MSRLAGLSLYYLARVGTRGRHELVQGLLHRVRARGRHRERRGLRDRHRAGRQGPPRPPAGRRDPHDLARPRVRRLELQARGVAAAVPPLVPLRLRPAGSRRRASSGPPTVRTASLEHERRARREGAWSPARPASSAATSSRSCSAGLRRRRRRQPLEVRQGRQELRRPPALPPRRGRRPRRRPDDRAARATATTSSPAPRSSAASATSTPTPTTCWPERADHGRVVRRGHRGPPRRAASRRSPT